jgi:diguanylate cyclase (GGDEF)-like protein
MGLGYRILVAKLGVTSVALVALLFVTFSVVMPAFRGLEEREVGRNWSRVQQTLAASGDALLTRAFDWAEWDDSYQFILDRNEEFVSTNFMSTTLDKMELSAMTFLDNNGRMVFETKTSQTVRFSGFGDHFFASLEGVKPGKSLGGMKVFEGRTYIFALRPVLKTGGKGKQAGWMIWAEELDQSAINKLSDQLGLRIDLKDFNGSARSNGLSYSFPTATEIAASATINNYRGQPRWILTVHDGREIFSLAKQTVVQMGVLQAVVLLTMLLGLSWLIKRVIITRIENMTGDVQCVNPAKGDRFVRVDGSDEITLLGTKINNMLMALSDSAQEIEGQKSKLIDINESLERLVFDRTRSLEQMNSVLQYALDGIAELSGEGRIRKVNSSIANLLGGQGFFERKFEEFLSTDSAATWRNAVSKLQYESRVELEISMNSVSHGRRELYCVLVGLGHENGGLETIHLFTKDVSENRKMQRDMEHQARRDPLTGLGNRRYLHDRLEHHLSIPGQDVAVLFMDLDNFKLINDTRGHKVGDRLLRSVGELMTNAADEWTEIARMGGDEFTMLVTGEDVLSRAIALAEELLEVFSKPVDIGDSLVYVSSSIGIAVGKPGKTSSNDIVRDADTAMYRAKANGKAGYEVYDEAMNAMVHERLKLEVGLRDAIENDQLVLLFQPLVCLNTGEIVGAEALLRWMHPEMGLVSPVKFIPIAEETGLIVPIGAWVLEEALRATDLLHNELGIKLHMNVNLSQRQLVAENIGEVVRAKLQASGVDAGNVTLEVTESMAMEDIDRSVEILQNLREIGVGLAIDDFGTGFSSLSYLQKLPVDKVKIDRSFVQYLGHDSRHTNVVTAILQLCRALDLQVVAEGIETEEQLEILKEIGCPVGQGYLFAKPMNIRALASFLQEWENGSKKAA